METQTNPPAASPAVDAKVQVVDVHPSGLTPTQLKQSETLCTQHPDLAKAATVFVTAADGFGNATLTLVVAFRGSKLTDADKALILRGRGVSRGRLSFLKRLWSMTDKDFKQVEEKKLTLKEAVKLEQAKKPGKGGNKTRKKNDKDVSPVPPVKFSKPAPALLVPMEQAASIVAKYTVLGGWNYVLRSDGHEIAVFVTRTKYDAKKE